MENFKNGGYALYYHSCCKGFSSRGRGDVLFHTRVVAWKDFKQQLGLKKQFTPAELIAELHFEKDQVVKFNHLCDGPERDYPNPSRHRDAISELTQELRQIQTRLSKLEYMF